VTDLMGVTTMKDTPELSPFSVAVSDDELKDLRWRLDHVRWAHEPVGGEGYGLSVDVVRDLVEHWRHRWDWRGFEARLNAYPQYVTDIDGSSVHFLHVRSPEPYARPLLLIHGWPGTVAEYLDVLDPLSDPRAHGLDPGIAFDLVVPSLPGSGFSGPTLDAGWGPRRIARALRALMERIGYTQYGAAGNDWGSSIAPEIGRIAPDSVVGVHVTQVWVPPPDENPNTIAALSAEDREAFTAFQDYVANHGAYAVVHSQAPETLAHALADSPVGLLGWNAQAMQPYGLDADTVISHVSIHWFTRTAGSAIRIYADAAREKPDPEPTTVPLGVAQFPDDLASVRAFAERAHSNIVSWNKYDRGGHYAAHNATDLLVGDIRRFFAALQP
jgi:epoxide hydrolase